MKNDFDLTKEELFQEIKRLRNEVGRLKSTKNHGEKTTQLLRKSMKELADLKRALDESTLFNITNREGRIIYANEKFCELSGYSKEDLFGKTHQIVKSGHHPPEFFKHMWETIMKGNIWHGEIKNKTKEGGYYWVDTTIVPLLNDEGQPKYFLGIRADVTKQKLIESQLEGQPDISRKFMNVSGGIFVFVNTDQSVAMINRRGCEILGYSANEVIGKNWFDSFLPYKIRGRMNETFSKLVKGEINEVEYLEFPIISRSGETREIAWHSTVLRNGSGQILGTLSSGIDITERKKVEAIQKGQNKVLHSLASAAPLEEVLTVLAKTTERVTSDLLCSILLWDSKKGYLCNSASPSLPNSYIETIDELAITYAMTTPKITLKKDTATPLNNTMIHMIRNQCQEVAQKSALQIALSELITSSSGKTLGVLIMYRVNQLKPDDSELELIKAAADLAGIAIERKNVENGLRESEARIRSILKTTVEGIITIDEKGIIETYNLACEKMFGYQESETVGNDISLLMPFHDGEEHSCNLSRYLQTGEKKIIGIGREVLGRRKDGNTFPICLSISETLLDDGRKIFTGVIRDLTDQKRAEEALKNSEARYRNVVEDQTEFIIRWSRDEKLTFVNESYCRYFGKSREDLIGTDFMPMVPEPDQQIVQDHLGSLNADNPLSSCEHRVILPDGSTGWTQWSSRAIFNDQNELIEIQSAGRDISDKKKSEQELLESKERIRSLIATAGNIIIYLSSDFRILEWNYEAERVFGWKRHEVLNKDYFSVCYYQIEFKSIYMNLNNITPGEPLRGLKNQVVTRDGAKRNLIWNFSRLHDSKGESGGIIAIGEDVSERKKEEELLRAKKELMSNKMEPFPLSDLAAIKYNVADKLNQPLTSIRVYSETLASFTKEEGDQVDSNKILNTVKNIIREVDRATMAVGHIHEMGSERKNPGKN